MGSGWWNARLEGDAFAAVEDRFAGTDSISRPPFWGGYRLVPAAWEFWQGRKSRLHDRLRYALQADGAWVHHRGPADGKGKLHVRMPDEHEIGIDARQSVRPDFGVRRSVFVERIARCRMHEEKFLAI